MATIDLQFLSVAGNDSAFALTDSSGNIYRLVATSGQLNVTKNGSSFASGGVAPVTAKTASYTMTAADSGGVFTTTGAAGTITFTLPAVATSTGYNYTFINGADQNMVITAPANTLVCNDATTATITGTTVTFSTASHKIGASCRVICDGTKWYVSLMTTSVPAVT